MLIQPMSMAEVDILPEKELLHHLHNLKLEHLKWNQDFQGGRELGCVMKEFTWPREIRKSVLPIHLVCVHAYALSRVWLFATSWTVVHQAPLSMEFSWQEYWSGLPFPTPWGLLIWGLNHYLLFLLHWQVDSLWVAPPANHLEVAIYWSIAALYPQCRLGAPLWRWMFLLS